MIVSGDMRNVRWNAGAIGAAAAYGHYALGLILSVANLFTLHLLRSRCAS
jgi:hypothetical protein